MDFDKITYTYSIARLNIRVIAAAGGILTDAWASKYHLFLNIFATDKHFRMKLAQAYGTHNFVSPVLFKNRE